MTNTETDLAEQIKRLLADRERHAAAIANIDRVLNQVSAVLGGTPEGLPVNGTQVPREEFSRGVRRRGRFAQTAEQSVLEFIGAKGRPSTADINAHWRAEGRKGTANVTLLKLLKDSQIRRIEDPTVRGSRYVIRNG
jgi:hypothetical protein